MHEVEDEPLFAERVAGIDIAKAGIEVTIRVPSETRRGGRQQETRSFRTTRKDLLALADWLRCPLSRPVFLQARAVEVGFEPTEGLPPRTPRKRVRGQPLRGFKSHLHRSGLQEHRP